MRHHFGELPLERWIVGKGAVHGIGERREALVWLRGQIERHGEATQFGEPVGETRYRAGNALQPSEHVRVHVRGRHEGIEDGDVRRYVAACRRVEAFPVAGDVLLRLRYPADERGLWHGFPVWASS